MTDVLSLQIQSQPLSIEVGQERTGLWVHSAILERFPTLSILELNDSSSMQSERCLFIEHTAAYPSSSLLEDISSESISGSVVESSISVSLELLPSVYWIFHYRDIVILFVGSSESGFDLCLLYRDRRSSSSSDPPLEPVNEFRLYPRLLKRKPGE